LRAELTSISPSKNKKYDLVLSTALAVTGGRGGTGAGGGVVWGAVAGLAAIAGPTLGGWLTTDFTWRWIFYVNVPVGIACFAFSWIALKEHREPGAGKFDPLGFIFSGFGTAGILFALSRGPEDGWTAPITLVTGLGGIVCFVLLVIVETRNPTPMLDLKLFFPILVVCLILVGIPPWAYSATHLPLPTVPALLVSMLSAYPTDNRASSRRLLHALPPQETRDDFEQPPRASGHGLLPLLDDRVEQIGRLLGGRDLLPHGTHRI